MPEIMSPRPSDRVETDPVTARVQDARSGLSALIADAEEARRTRDEGTTEGGSAVWASGRTWVASLTGTLPSA